MTQIHTEHMPYLWLSDNSLHSQLPDPHCALDEPNGLLAAGGALDPESLLNAYSRGIFPWFNSDDEAILWWSPDPRGVIEPGSVKVSRSLAKRIRSGVFRVTADVDFTGVIAGCAETRVNRSDDNGELCEEGTWITSAMSQAYLELHRQGYAHSVEVWENDQLVGGLYGVALGGAFFGESMFSRRSDASKVALVTLASALAARGFGLIDCQHLTPHLASLGAVELGRNQFLERLSELTNDPGWRGFWQFDL